MASILSNSAELSFELKILVLYKMLLHYFLHSNCFLQMQHNHYINYKLTDNSETYTYLQEVTLPTCIKIL